MRRPNFLYIGPDKSGSTWLYFALLAHPEVFLPGVKDLYFFDRYYDRGIDWYLSKFRNARLEQTALGELSHDYLYSAGAVGRICRDLPGVRILTILRNPADRAFSQWLFRRKHGVTTANFEDDIENCEEILERSRYARHLSRYFDQFDRSRVFVGMFSQLQRDPVLLANEIYKFLGVQPQCVSETYLREPRLPAAQPRIRTLARSMHGVAKWARLVGMEQLLGKLKTSSLVQKALYRGFDSGEKPQIDPATRSHLLRVTFRDDISLLEDLLGCELPEMRD